MNLSFEQALAYEQKKKQLVQLSKELASLRLTPKQAAEALGLSKRALEDRRQRGARPVAIKIGNMIRYAPDELIDLLTEG